MDPVRTDAPIPLLDVGEARDRAHASRHSNGSRRMESHRRHHVLAFSAYVGSARIRRRFRCEGHAIAPLECILVESAARCENVYRFKAGGRRPKPYWRRRVCLASTFTFRVRLRRNFRSPSLGSTDGPREASSSDARIHRRLGAERTCPRTGRRRARATRRPTRVPGVWVSCWSGAPRLFPDSRQAAASPGPVDLRCTWRADRRRPRLGGRTQRGIGDRARTHRQPLPRRHCRSFPNPDYSRRLKARRPRTR